MGFISYIFKELKSAFEWFLNKTQYFSVLSRFCDKKRRWKTGKASSFPWMWLSSKSTQTVDLILSVFLLEVKITFLLISLPLPLKVWFSALISRLGITWELVRHAESCIPALALPITSPFWTRSPNISLRCKPCSVLWLCCTKWH